MTFLFSALFGSCSVEKCVCSSLFNTTFEGEFSVCGCPTCRAFSVRWTSSTGSCRAKGATFSCSQTRSELSWGNWSYGRIERREAASRHSAPWANAWRTWRMVCLMQSQRTWNSTSSRRASGWIQAIFSRDRQWDQREQAHQRPILQGGWRRRPYQKHGRKSSLIWRMTPQQETPSRMWNWKSSGSKSEGHMRERERDFIRKNWQEEFLQQTLCGCWPNSPLRTCVRLGFRPWCTSKQSHGTSWTWRWICVVRWPPDIERLVSQKQCQKAH